MHLLIVHQVSAKINMIDGGRRWEADENECGSMRF